MESTVIIPENTGLEVLEHLSYQRGILWENIEIFLNQLSKIEGVTIAGTKEMDTIYPVKHHLEDGLYTRELFIPKGHLVVSYIHKQNHPSFLLKGDISLLLDTGEIQRLKAPQKVFTKIGTQRVCYTHEDVTWVCVYKTRCKKIKSIEKEIYTLNYKELPMKIINKQLKSWQEQ